MRAALAFANDLTTTGRLHEVTRISCSLYGSLGSTGLGHGTPDDLLETRCRASHAITYA